MFVPTPGHSTLLRRLPALAALLLSLAIPGRALAVPVPGTPDPEFGASGATYVLSTTSSDLPHSATGKDGAFVTGESFRGNVKRLFLAKFRTDGTLEPTFAASGPTPGRALLMLDWPTEGRMVRQQSDGKLVVVGTHYVPNSYEIVVARFNVAGTLDTTFGVNGAYSRHIDAYAYGSAVDIQADGKIVVAGTMYDAPSGGFDIAVLRLNANGTPDATFGTGGMVKLDFRQGFDAARAIVATAGGKILVAGTSASGPTGRNGFSIARLEADGRVDTTFGPARDGGLPLINVGNGDLAAMSVTSDAIWLGGTGSNRDASLSMTVVKLTPAGLLDTAFNGTGIAMTPSGNDLWGFAMAMDDTGIFVGGLANPRFAVARFNLDGTLDAGFGLDGITVDPDVSFGGVQALSIRTDGRIIAIGAMPEVPTNGRQDIARVRYTGHGGRDSTYGTAGKALTNLFDLSWDMRAVSMEADGRIVMAGSLYDAHDSDFGVVRLLANGLPDYSFGGGGGVQSISFPGGSDHVYAMLKQADGMRVLAGSSGHNGTTGFALARITPDLTPDYFGFGTDGRTTHTMGFGYAEILALAEAPDGKIVAAGYALASSTDYDFAIARYSANGLLDPTFGSGGVVRTSLGTGQDVANAVAVQPDGKIVAAGYKRVGGLFDFAVVRYNLNGTQDASFGNLGVVVIPVGASTDIARSLAILPDGKILVAGESFSNATSNDMAVVRLNANGSIDGTFGSAGVALVNFTGGADSATSMAVQPNGKIVLAGTAIADGPGGSQRAFALARLLPDGARDLAFGSGFAAGGFATNDITSFPDTAYALALQRNGMIVSAGVVGAQWGVTRYFGDPRPQFFATDMDGDGHSDILYRNVSDGRVYRLLMNGMAITSNAQAYVEPDLNWRIVGDGDFNGDGIADLLWRNDSDGRIYVMLFTAAGMPGPGAVIHTEPNIAWKIVATPDLDGDHKSDIVWWNSNTGQVYVMLVNGLSLGAEGLVYTEPDTAWKIAAAGDFAASGKTNQLLWRHGSTGQVFLMTVTVTAGTFGQTGQMVYTEPNLAWKIVAAADFNGDGRSDILWRNDSDGRIYIMLMNGPNIVTQGLMYSEPNLDWKIVAQGDYNGDGKADILWRNDVTGEVYMLLMNGLVIALRGTVYTEPNLAWKLLGPREYALANGIQP
jgi:uncharacterized delta-60 repeat protein